ncbi:MAG: ParB/RepB/Spo0J family partition protein [Pseudobdellovibrionaceae bacterium]|nr:ParB/RepB/Spo0J family partition protein [Pseudobdellovibrionaceae bacterium]
MTDTERATDTMSEISNSDGLAFHKDQASGQVNGIPMQIVKTITDSKSEGQVINVPLRYLSDGANIRKKIENDDDFKGLVESIKERGLIQYPTIAYQKGKICVIAGNRRIAAVRLLGWEKVKCVVKIIADESERLHIQLAENINRSNLKPIDYAEAISRFKEESGLTNERIGELFGKSRKYIEQLVKIGSWSDEVRNLIEINEIEITPLIKIAFKKESKDPKWVLQEIKKIIGESTSQEDEKSKKDLPTQALLREKRHAQIQTWVSSKGYSEKELGMILSFLSDMKIRGWVNNGK